MIKLFTALLAAAILSMTATSAIAEDFVGGQYAYPCTGRGTPRVAVNLSPKYGTCNCARDPAVGSNCSGTIVNFRPVGSQSSAPTQSTAVSTQNCPPGSPCEALAEQYRKEMARLAPTQSGGAATVPAVPQGFSRNYSKQVVRLFTPDKPALMLQAGVNKDPMAAGIWNLPIEVLLDFDSSFREVGQASWVDCTVDLVKGRREYGYDPLAKKIANASNPLTACPSGAKVLKSRRGDIMALSTGWGLTDPE